MQYSEIETKALEVKRLYGELNKVKGENTWTATEFIQALVGDVGDLVKLNMAKNKFRDYEDVDTKLAHELADCLWAIIVIANELNIDLPLAFTHNMEELKQKIKNNL